MTARVDDFLGFIGLPFISLRNRSAGDGKLQVRHDFAFQLILFRKTNAAKPSASAGQLS
jgi:hypothetical protein